MAVPIFIYWSEFWNLMKEKEKYKNGEYILGQ